MADKDKQAHKQENTVDQAGRPEHQQKRDPLEGDMEQFGNSGIDLSYSYRGLHEPTGDQEQNNIRDAFDEPASPEEQAAEADAFAQDQFGDLDDNDEYNNLYETEPQKTPAGAEPDPGSLYELEAPLAEPGSENPELRKRDRAGTPVSMDQLGNQQ
jgi:hypothetical protein